MRLPLHGHTPAAEMSQHRREYLWRQIPEGDGEMQMKSAVKADPVFL